MELYERAMFDELLREAAGNFAERCLYRAGGAEPALAALAGDPQALGRTDFVDAFFAEHLLDGTAGACFVLQALERRTLAADPGGPADQMLARMAKAAFADVLTVKTAQTIEQQRIYS